MITLIFAYFFLLLITFLQILIGSNATHSSWLLGLLVPFLSIGSVFGIVALSKDKNWVEKELYNSRGWWRVLFGVVLSFLVVGVFHLLWNKLAVSYGYTPLIFQLKEVNLIVTLVMQLSFYSLIEELLFRGFFQEEINKMVKHLPLSLSLFYQILIPTLLFCLMHCFKMGLGCLVIIVPSLFFGLLKYHSKNIYAAFGSHLIFNLYYSMIIGAPF